MSTETQVKKWEDPTLPWGEKLEAVIRFKDGRGMFETTIDIDEKTKESLVASLKEIEWSDEKIATVEILWMGTNDELEARLEEEEDLDGYLDDFDDER